MRLLHEVPSSLFENIDYFLKWSPKTTSYNFPRFLNHDAQYGSRLVDELIQIYKTYGSDATIPEWKNFRMSLIESDTIHISFHDIYREESYDRSYIQAFIRTFMTYRVSGYRQCISIINSDEWSSEEKLAMAIIVYYLPDECHMSVMDFFLKSDRKTTRALLKADWSIFYVFGSSISYIIERDYGDDESIIDFMSKIFNHIADMPEANAAGHYLNVTLMLTASLDVYARDHADNQNIIRKFIHWKYWDPMANSEFDKYPLSMLDCCAELGDYLEFDEPTSSNGVSK
jgi:hypothetical protein